MSKYEIHPIEGDIPYATMHGDFSMDDLLVILDEMREVYQGSWAEYAEPTEPSPSASPAPGPGSLSSTTPSPCLASYSRPVDCEEDAPLKTLTYDDAWNAQITFPNLPHGWIQWKGADICIDIHCACGELTHYDGSHMYIIICPHCSRAYFANGHVQLIEIEEVDRPAKIACE